jgi:hypothetical protein
VAHHRASSAHFYAHVRFGGARYPIAKLRPIQIVLVSLFEDARVEQLAMQSRPGLRDLWSPYIKAMNSDGNDVPALLRQLTRALFDPEQPTANPWVEKAQRWFYARRSEWNDPALSRELGNLLGNDLGQMRLQFDWKGYAVEPLYRDDHRGLWCNWSDDNDPIPQDIQHAGIRIDNAATAVATAAMAAEDSARSSEVGEWLSGGKVVAAGVETLPEWDYKRQCYRSHWVSVRQREIADGSVAQARKLAGISVPWLHNRLPGNGRRRFRRGASGDTIDLDACIRHRIDGRLGLTSDPRIYRQPTKRPQPRASLILIDMSLSMAQPSKSQAQLSIAQSNPHENSLGITALEYAAAVALQITRFAQLRGDRVAIYGFCSDGRHALFITPIKSFDEIFAEQKLLARLSGLNAAYSTRLGAALRYAQQLFSDDRIMLREIVLLGDGEASDIDAFDPNYLHEDVLQAHLEIQRANIELRVIAVTDE